MSTHDFGILLGLAYQGFADQLREDLAGRGFTDLGPAYGYVVRAIDDQPGVRQRDLARELGITEQGLGKIVQEMVQRGYLRRRPDRADRRAHHLELDARGRALLGAARRFHARFERALAGELGRSVATTRRVLETIVARSSDPTSRGRLRAV